MKKEPKRKPGRPPLPDAERLRRIGIALLPATIDALREVASETGQTQTQIVESALEREFKRLRRPR
jgi:hypothetical protein